MGLRYYCYIEELTEQGWSNLVLNNAEFAEIGLSANPNNHPRFFLDTQSFYTFYSDPSYVVQFFLGEHVLFNFTEGMPSDKSEQLKPRITNHTGFCWWIDFSNLMIDDWDSTQIRVKKPISENEADKFGDGRKLLTREQLVFFLQDFNRDCDYPGDMQLVKPSDSYNDFSFNGSHASFYMKLSEYFPPDFMRMMRYFNLVSGSRTLRLYLVYED